MNLQSAQSTIRALALRLVRLTRALLLRVELLLIR
jgi:hypothetical protein